MLWSWCRVINSADNLAPCQHLQGLYQKTTEAHRLDHWPTTFADSNTTCHLNEIGSPDLIIVRLVCA